MVCWELSDLIIPTALLGYILPAVKCVQWVGGHDVEPILVDGHWPSQHVCSVGADLVHP